MKFSSFVLFALFFATPTFALDSKIFVMQAALEKMGYEIGSPDGIAGRRTRAALAKYGNIAGIEPTIDAFYAHLAERVSREKRPVDSPELIASVENATKETLKDPFSARFGELYFLPSGWVCGTVNAKNAYGAYVGSTYFYTVGRPIVLSDKVVTGSVELDNSESRFATHVCLTDFFNPPPLGD